MKSDIFLVPVGLTPVYIAVYGVLHFKDNQQKLYIKSWTPVQFLVVLWGFLISPDHCYIMGPVMGQYAVFD